MSTKALRLVVLAAEQAATENGEMTGEVANALAAAKTELNAIEKAASDMTRIKARLQQLPNLSWSAQEIHDANMADAVMHSIATQDTEPAPRS